MCIVLYAVPAHSQWVDDGALVCGAADDQHHVRILPDGLGGAFIAWQDRRGGDYDIYMQSVDHAGVVRWAAYGIVVCGAAGDQEEPQIAADGAGGAFIVWHDGRGAANDIYAQRVDEQGNRLWAVTGVPLCIASEWQWEPRIVADGAGGAIVTWYDSRNGYPDIYAQRIDGSGVVAWTANGVPVSTAPNTQTDPRIVTDGLGGAIITWWDDQVGDGDIYAQRIDGAGNSLWSANGIAVCAATAFQIFPEIVPDGFGGAIIVWNDGRSGNWDVYAQAVDANGTLLWAAGGLPIVAEANDQWRPRITPNGSGGAILVWEDDRDQYYDIYAQRIDRNGAILWTPGGVAVCTADWNQNFAAIASDGYGGAIITWIDDRNEIFDTDIYAQRIDPNGNPRWEEGGIAICTAAYSQEEPVAAPNGLGGAIIAWHDYRGDDYDVYAQRVDTTGVLPALLESFHAVSVGDAIEVCWTLAETGEGMAFFVLRAGAAAGTFEEIPSPVIERNGFSFRFMDMAVDPGTLYRYRVDVVDGEGRRMLFETGPVTTPSRPFVLFQNHPNPFNPVTVIPFSIGNAGRVRLSILDAAGHTIRCLVDEHRPAGTYREIWGGTDDAGRNVVSGVYFYRLDTRTFKNTRKMILLR